MSKDLLMSRVTWGTIISMVALIATASGYDIGDQDQLVNLIVGVLGGALALYGRVAAVKPIESVAGVKIKKEVYDGYEE